MESFKGRRGMRYLAPWPGCFLRSVVTCGFNVGFGVVYDRLFLQVFLGMFGVGGVCWARSLGRCFLFSSWFGRVFWGSAVGCFVPTKKDKTKGEFTFFSTGRLSGSKLGMCGSTAN